VNVTASLRFVLGCGPAYPVTYLTPARPEIPTFDGSLSSGLSPLWVFAYSNGTTTTNNGTTTISNATLDLDVVVLNGTAIALATFSPRCADGGQIAIPGSGIVDSPVALAAAVASNSSYIDAHPELNASFGLGLIPGGQGQPQWLGWGWGVQFTTCAPFAQIFSSGSIYNGSAYDDIVNASTGVAFPGGSTVVPCSTYG
jgi:hypothetical protein